MHPQRLNSGVAGLVSPHLNVAEQEPFVDKTPDIGARIGVAREIGIISRLTIN